MPKCQPKSPGHDPPMFLFFGSEAGEFWIPGLEHADLCFLFFPQVNQPKFNQRRISSAKFLGELYNYRMVESAVVFRTLFSFISFGVNPDGSPSPLDPPEHLFRIRLVCTLLDTCGQYFDRGSSKKKLDCFLIYFQVCARSNRPFTMQSSWMGTGERLARRCLFPQRYIWWKKSVDVWTKDHPFPIDIDYMISDTLELLRPKMRLSGSLDEATKQVADLEREVLVKLGEDEFPDAAAAGFSGFLPAEQHSPQRRRTALSSETLAYQTHALTSKPVSTEDQGTITGD